MNRLLDEGWAVLRVADRPGGIVFVMGRLPEAERSGNKEFMISVVKEFLAANPPLVTLEDVRRNLEHLPELMKSLTSLSSRTRADQSANPSDETKS